MRVLILMIEVSKFEDVLKKKKVNLGKNYSKIIRSFDLQKDIEKLSKSSNRLYFISDEIW
jgi:hypothetical protein